MEGAARVFAGEYNSSTLQVPGEGDRSASWVVTPGGLWCRLIYIAGVLTEIEETCDLTRCRVADPTGGFDIVLHGTGTPCAEALKKIPVPSFVTVTGHARMFRKNNNVILTVSPDIVMPTDRAVRDQWILTTAEATLKRLEQLHLAMLNRCTEERFRTAQQYYCTTPAKIQELAAMVESAVLAICPPEGEVPARPEARSLVVDLIQSNNGPRGVAVEEIIRQAAGHGVSQEAVLKAVESLILDDECYQPQKGFVKLL
jgi:hypothetical protein